MSTKICKLLVCCFFVVVVLCVSVSADNSSFTSNCIAPFQSTWSKPDALNVCSTGNVSIAVACRQSDKTVYVGAVVNENGTQLDHLIYLSTSSDASVWADSRTTGSIATYGLNQSITDDDQNVIAYFSYGSGYYWSNFTVEPYIPVFNSDEDAKSAFIRDIVNVTSTDVLSYVDIPSGYVAVVYAKNPSSSSPAGLRSNFSWSSAPNAPYWGNTGQSYKFFDSRPVFTDQTLFPLNGMSAIGWEKGRSTGFNGNTTNAVGEISFSSSLHWCVIYNPWVTFDSSATDPKYNSTIRLHAYIAEAYLYPCSQLIGADGWESRSLDDWSNPYVGNAPVDEGGDWYWTEPSEIPGDPPVVVDPGAGGTNEVPPEVTNQNFLQRIIAILDNLLAEISGLFTFAFRAIAALVDAAASFFAVIGGLFIWLPADVVTVIVSGFFLVVTIGVLKSFL